MRLIKAKYSMAVGYRPNRAGFVCLLLASFLFACNQVEYPDTSDLPDNFHQLVVDAKKGDVDSQFDLGVEYLSSKYIEKNPQKALAWFKIAAQHGDAEAMYNVGSLLHSNNDLGIDIKQAIYWYKKAADKGYPKAAFNLSMIYLNNEKYYDSKEYIYWTSKASDLGYVPAMHNLAAEYSSGKKLKKDPGKAYLLYKKAALNGFVNSMFVMGQIYDEGYSVDKDLRMALAWKELGMKYAGMNSEIVAIRDEQNKIQKIKSLLTSEELEESKKEFEKLEKILVTK